MRYASSEPGEHSYSLPNGGYGTVMVEPYMGRNVLYRRGPLRVSEDRRFLMHADGTPFFWLGDTWWMGLCRRLAWPGEFRALLDDRARKGFTVVQIVAGLYPDQPAFDERSANEAGFPWEPDYSAIRPAYFDMADRRIRALVERGLCKQEPGWQPDKGRTLGGWHRLYHLRAEGARTGQAPAKPRRGKTAFGR